MTSEHVPGGSPLSVRIDCDMYDADKRTQYDIVSYYHGDINAYWAIVYIKNMRSGTMNRALFYKSRAKKMFEMAQRIK